MKSAILLVFLAVIAVGCASPSAVEDHSLVRHRRQALDLFGNTRKLIEELIANLNKAGQQARDAVIEFNKGLVEQAKRIRDRFAEELDKLKHRVTDSFNKLQDKFANSNTAVRECVNSRRNNAEAIFTKASQETVSCIDTRIRESGELIQEVTALSEEGNVIVTNAIDQLRNCTSDNTGNILTVGACLGTTAIKTEIKGAAFLMQSGLAIGRLNVFMSTTPASLEICAGQSLVNAGMGTAKLLMEIGSCSASSIITNFGGSSFNDAASSALEQTSSALGSVTSNLPSASSVLGSASSNLGSVISKLPSASSILPASGSSILPSSLTPSFTNNIPFRP